MPAGPPAFDLKSNSAARRFSCWNAARKDAMSLPRVRGLIFALASLTIAIVVGCELPLRPRTGSDVVEVRVAPESVTLDPNQTQPFVASGRTAAGATVPIDVTWTAAGGTITSGGLFTAGQTAGSYRVIAGLTNGSLADTSAVTVTAIPVASVTVAPSSAGIQVGDTLRLTATPRDSAGNVLTGRTITWSSDSAAVASVSGSGLVTGLRSGTATIRATSEGREGEGVVWEECVQEGGEQL